MRVLLILRQRSGVKARNGSARSSMACATTWCGIGREDRREEPWDDKVEEAVELTWTRMRDW